MKSCNWMVVSCQHSARSRWHAQRDDGKTYLERGVFTLVWAGQQRSVWNTQREQTEEREELLPFLRLKIQGQKAVGEIHLSPQLCKLVWWAPSCWQAVIRQEEPCEKHRSTVRPLVPFDWSHTVVQSRVQKELSLDRVGGKHWACFRVMATPATVCHSWSFSVL